MMMAKQVVDKGLSYRQASSIYRCSHGTVSHWVKLYRTGVLPSRLKKEKRDAQAKGHDFDRLERHVKNLKTEIGELYLENLMLKKALEYMELREWIEKIHLELPGYGYRRIRHHLLREGKRVNGKRIQRVMKKYSLLSCLQRMMKTRGEKAGIKLFYPNLIRGMKINGPNQVWATDLTYIKLLREYVYLNAVIDVYTRKIVGWAISRDLSHKFCLQALELAVKRYRPPEGLIHHSDRGVQYACIDYVGYLQKQKFQISQSRLATPKDNAFIESFFRTMKKEEVYFKDYKTMSDVIKNLPKFIDEVYNTKRLHSSLGYKTPAEFEEEILKTNPAKRPVQKIWGWTA